MLLVIDVGNTNTKIGVFDGERLLVSWTLTTRREQTADEYGVFTGTLLATRGLAPRDIEGVAISNVVPPVQQVLERMAEQYFGATALSVEPGLNIPLVLAVDNLHEVGPDRIVSALAGQARYGAPLSSSTSARRRGSTASTLVASSSAGRSPPASPWRWMRCSTAPRASSASSWSVPRRRSAATRSPTSSPGSCTATRGSSTDWSSA